MKHPISPDLPYTIGSGFLNDKEWQEWLSAYAALRSETFLRILQDKEEKIIQQQYP